MRELCSPKNYTINQIIDNDILSRKLSSESHVWKCLYIIIEQCPITGPPLAGVIVDQTHSLRLPLVISTVVQGASTIMAGVTCAVNRGQKKGYLNML